MNYHSVKRSNNHYALPVPPEDPAELQEGILHIVRELRDEAPLWVIQKFGVSVIQAKMLIELSRLGPVDRKYLHTTCMWEATNNTFDQQVKRLSDRLAVLGFSLNGRKILSLDAKAGADVQTALLGFRKCSEEMCRILGTRSLKISEDSLPSDEAALNEMLGNLQGLFRSDPQKLSTGSVTFSLGQRMVLSVFDAAIRDGLDFIFYHRLKMAMFPSYSPASIETNQTAATFLYNTLEKIGVSETERGQNFTFLLIPEAVREALSAGYHFGVPKIRQLREIVNKPLPEVKPIVRRRGSEGYHALVFPKSPEKLRRTICETARQLQEEAPLWVIQAFGAAAPETRINVSQAKILMALAQRGSSVSQLIHKLCAPELDHLSFLQSILTLKESLTDLGISLSGQKVLTLDAKGCRKVDSALAAFHKSNEAICRILRSTSLDVTPNAFRQGAIFLTFMLTDLLASIRGNPERSPITDMPLTPGQKITLGVFDAALRDGHNFIFYHRLKMALYPAFSTSDADADKMTAAYLGETLRELGVPNYGNAVKNHTYFLIPAGVREVLGRESKAAPEFAGTPVNRLGHARASLIL